jgi:hypothetical protein
VGPGRPKLPIDLHRALERAERLYMSGNIVPITDGQANPSLAEHAAVIRTLGKRVVGDIIEIGRRFKECRDIVGHGHWHPWLDAEFGWSEQTALNYMRVYEMVKSKNILDLDISISALYLLAAPSTSEEARTEILGRAKAGENVPVAAVKKIIAGKRANNKADVKRKTINAKPLPDIVDGCIAVVRRRIEDTVLELNRYTPKKRHASLERLFAGLTDTITDLEHKTLPAAEENAAMVAEKGKALSRGTEKGSEPVTAVLKQETAA